MRTKKCKKGKGWSNNKSEKCGELATPLLTVKPVGVYSTILVQYLYISCYLSDNKPVLSYLLSRLLPQKIIMQAQETKMKAVKTKFLRISQEGKKQFQRRRGGPRHRQEKGREVRI
jgi:hypothetical protein